MVSESARLRDFRSFTLRTDSVSLRALAGPCVTRTQDIQSAVSVSTPGAAVLRITWSFGFGLGVYSNECGYIFTYQESTNTSLPTESPVLVMNTTAAAVNVSIASIPAESSNTAGTVIGLAAAALIVGLSWQFVRLFRRRPAGANFDPVQVSENL